MFKEIPINLSSHIYYALLKDIKNFNFVTKSGNPNKSGFVSRIFVNYSYFKNEHKNTINLNLYDKYNNILSAEQLLELQNYVNGLFNFALYDDTSKYRHEKRIYLKPTKSNMNALAQMYDEELHNIDASRYLRNIINEYVSKPQFIRQQIIFINELSSIQNAIDNKNIINFFYQNKRFSLAAIDCLYHEKLEKFILICHSTEKEKTYFFPVQDISTILVTDKTADIKDNIHKLIDKDIEIYMSN